MRLNKYDLNIPEEQLKNQVKDDFFAIFDTSKIIKNIDFSIAVKSENMQQGEIYEMPFLLFAEAKRGNKSNIIESFVQLILTMGNNSINGDKIYTIYSPEFLCAFDAEKIAFIPYEKVKHIFYKSDFDWKIKPSNHKTKAFNEIQEIIKPLLENEKLQFNYLLDEAELKDFISKNLVVNSKNKLYQITKNNFTDIYYKWRLKVLPTILVNWEEERKKGIIDADFYLADLISTNNESIRKDLFVVLKQDHYEYNKTKIKNFLGLYQAEFNDKQKAHKEFWKKYKRPPEENIQQHIIERRDLLVLPDIRERKGSFFTPQIWREKAQEYLAKTFGENWQSEYYIWDCAAGTGNLLVGLTERDNIFASTIDKADVDIIKELGNIPKNHIFQFDFLNDDFNDDKVPEKLKNILNNEEERQKLIIFINPPYAEATSFYETTKTRKAKGKVARDNKTFEKYKNCIGNASNELFAQFFIRIYKEIPDCILASFSTLKYVNSQNFKKFREVFKAKFLKGFMIPANTFDNVKGEFPIGFLIWNLSKKNIIKSVRLNIYNSKNKFIGNKKFYSYHNTLSITKWKNTFDNEKRDIKAYIQAGSPDFQTQKYLCLLNEEGTMHLKYIFVNKNNLIQSSIYFAVRHCIKATWINDRDQFLYPKKGWENDFTFHGDCLIYTLFHGQNKISSEQGENNFIPFKYDEMNCKNAPDSDFMVQYLKDFQKGKYQITTPTNLEKNSKNLVEKSNLKIEFSAQAKDVLNAGKNLFKYYHEQTNSEFPNASLYDIKKYFQGVSAKTGRVNSKSNNEKYNDLLETLKDALQILAQNIEIKVYEYEFLLN